MPQLDARYLPLDGKPFTVGMGLRALEIGQWLEIDDSYIQDIDLKKSLYQQHPSQVFACLPEGISGSIETLELISEHLAQLFPELEIEPVSPALHPLQSASLLVQEDLCVMSKIDGQWKLTAASVCFPSRWDLTEKIGASLREIHAPVPHYEERIGQATDIMFDKFEVERPVWRINWTILDNPDLFQPRSIHREISPDLSLEEFAQKIYFRIERQTLRVLPKSGDVLFTIRTYVDSLSSIAQRYPQFQTNLAETLAAASLQTRDYKGWPSIWDKLRAWSQTSA